MAVNIKMNDRTIDASNSRSSGRKNTGRRKKIFIILSILFVLLLTITLCGYFLGEKTGLKFSITDILNPIKANPQLKRDSSEKYTNSLFVGIDSRSANSGLKNTDTIILASYNHETHDMAMTSIPRDFFVEVPGQGRYTKINSIYAIGEGQNPGNGLNLLQEVVEEITGKEIQYHGMVNLSGFVDLIDTLGGIEVDVENSFTDHRYPIEGAEARHQTISFVEGLQTMDGKDALRFVRSRHSLDNHEGSDFARARRQQRVIDAIRKEVLSSTTLLNPRKAINILNILDNNIRYSDFTNEEMQAALKILQKENMETYSFVLDPSIANHKLVTDRGLESNLYTVTPIAGLGNYEEINKYIRHAHEKPLLYSEEPTILVYDVGLGYEKALEETNIFIEENPSIEITFRGTLLSSIGQDYLYTTSEEHYELDQKIEEYFGIKMTEQPDFMVGETTNGNYIILLGSND